MGDDNRIAFAYQRGNAMTDEELQNLRNTLAELAAMERKSMLLKFAFIALLASCLVLLSTCRANAADAELGSRVKLVLASKQADKIQAHCLEGHRYACLDLLREFAEGRIEQSWIPSAEIVAWWANEIEAASGDEVME